MQKMTTTLKKTVENPRNEVSTVVKMYPSSETLKKILQFAAIYRVEKIGNNQFVETYLN